MMSSLTISLMLSLALPTAAVVRGTVLSPVRGRAEDIASMIKSIMEQRASQSVELMSAGEGRRQSSPVEREPAAALPTSSTAASPSSGTASPPAPQAEQPPAEPPAAGSDASTAPSSAPSPAPLPRAASEPYSGREALPLFLRQHLFLGLLLGAAGLTALGGGLVLRRRRCKRCGGALILLGDEALSEGQRVEQRLGSVRYRMRECRPCGVVFRRWRRSALRGRDVCPDCGFHTLHRKTTRFRAPTFKRPGVERVEILCAYCAYHRAREEVLLQLVGDEES